MFRKGHFRKFSDFPFPASQILFQDGPMLKRTNTHEKDVIHMLRSLKYHISRMQKATLQETAEYDQGHKTTNPYSVC